VSGTPWKSLAYGCLELLGVWNSLGCLELLA
jgi:hypothetical protein